MNTTENASKINTAELEKQHAIIKTVGKPETLEQQTYAAHQERINLESERQKSKIKDASQIRWLRWVLAGFIIVICILHLVILYYFIDKTGNNNLKNNLPFISDNVMLMFLGTTTVDIFLLLRVITQFLFPINKK